MAKFSGKIGFVIDEEVSPGVFMPKTYEKNYYGDIVRHGRRWDTPNEVSDNLTLSDEISIVADSYLRENLGAIRYVVRFGVKWSVNYIEPNYPRIRLTLGGTYNGDSGR